MEKKVTIIDKFWNFFAIFIFGPLMGLLYLGTYGLYFFSFSVVIGILISIVTDFDFIYSVFAVSKHTKVPNMTTFNI